MYLLTVAVCVVFYWAYRQWAAWIMLLAVLLFPWLSLIISLPAMLSFRAQPEAPRRIPMGGEAAVTLTGKCRLPLPPFKGRVRISKPLTGESWKLKSGEALPTGHCGALTAAPCRVKVYDYLGLWKKSVRKLETSAVTVYPKRVEMPVPPELDRYLARSWRPKFGGGYSENHELRLYRPGDSLNQVHWKLSAKTGKLILREPMEPERGLILLTMDVCGTPEELDEKFGQLLWLGDYLLEKGLPFEIRALAGSGLEAYPVSNRQELQSAVDALLGCTPVTESSIRDRAFSASWQYHIGGGRDET